MKQTLIAPRAAWQRWEAMLGIALLAALPLAFTPIPPLVDVPGHLGQYAIQLSAPDGPLLRYFSFEPRFVLNMGVDTLVHLLAPVLGLIPTVRLIATLMVVLTTLGVLLLARTTSRTATTLPWALLFVWSLPVHYGFLNYIFTASLSLLGYVGWIRLAARPRLRATLYILLQPILILSHAVGGLLLPAMIGSYEFFRLWDSWRQAGRRGEAAWQLIRAVWPLLVSVLVVIAWIITAEPGSGETRWLLFRKMKDASKVLRDQHKLLDLASAAAAMIVPLTGLWLGARYRRGTVGPVIAVFLMFWIIPGYLSGSSFIDMRMVPMFAILLLAQLDWTHVAPRVRAIILWSGLALLVVRMAITTAAFINYRADYDSELGALAHIAPGSRVLNLTGRQCKGAGWRFTRIEHMSSMALAERQAWSNGQWDIGDIHMTHVTYRPGGFFYHDPTHYVFPERCLKKKPSSNPMLQRRTIAQALPLIPIDDADYLWLIRTELPAGYRDPRLVLLWTNGKSSLYAIRPSRGRTPAQKNSQAAPTSQPAATSLGQWTPR